MVVSPLVQVQFSLRQNRAHVHIVQTKLAFCLSRQSASTRGISAIAGFLETEVPRSLRDVTICTAIFCACETGRVPEIANLLVGLEMRAVCVVRDYVELHFNGPIVRALSNPRGRLGECSWQFPERDAPRCDAPLRR
jgi:hypothetical protein